MSEPVIPERPSEAERYATMVLDLEAKVAELEADASDATDFGQAESERYEAALDVLEAKVAEQAATFLAENRAMLKDLNDWVEKARHAEKVVTQQAATIERLTKELDQYKPHCGHTILSDNLGRVYGCGKLDGHDGPHETVEERRTALSKQEPK